jgi:tetratricopeptide (TPR) repeat protein
VLDYFLDYSDALSLAPNSPDVLTLRGHIFLLINEIPKAVQYAQRALGFYPDHAPARELLRRVREVRHIKEEGNTYFNARRFGEAVERYDKALDVVGEHLNEGAWAVVL